MVPTLTPAQRARAAQKSLEMRQARATLKRVLVVDVSGFKMAWYVDIAQGMKAIDLLTALPGIGMRRALTLLQQAGIPSHNTVRACGPRQTEKLFAALDER